jgi:zinc protease
LFVYGLAPDYYRTLPDQIHSVTAEEVRHVAERYLKPEEMVVVAVGERTKIEPQLEKLELGPIEIHDSSGNPVETSPECTN